MSRFSLKPTKSKHTVSKTVKSIDAPNYVAGEVRSTVISRFIGMSRNTEKVASLIIPGYKTRG